MKKLVFIMVLAMAALMVNAQVNTPDTSDTRSKSPTMTNPRSGGTSLPAADLPKAITDNIARDYPGFTVKNAWSVSDKEGLKYKVDVTKGSENETLLYDKEGKFLKKVSKSDMHDEMKK